MGLWWEEAESAREFARGSSLSVVQDPGPRGEYPGERARVREESERAHAVRLLVDAAADRALIPESAQVSQREEVS